MTESELVAALRPVADALDALGVRYYICGSIASSEEKDESCSHAARWSVALMR